jgi:hypothetical protein
MLRDLLTMTSSNALGVPKAKAIMATKGVTADKVDEAQQPHSQPAAKLARAWLNLMYQGKSSHVPTASATSDLTAATAGTPDSSTEVGRFAEQGKWASATTTSAQHNDMERLLAFNVVDAKTPTVRGDADQLTNIGSNKVRDNAVEMRMEQDLNNIDESPYLKVAGADVSR